MTATWPCRTCGTNVAPVPGLPGLGRCATCDSLQVQPEAREVALPPHMHRAGDPLAVLVPDAAFAARYRLDRVLGTGAFAAVFRAVQHRTGRVIALKFLRQPLDPEDHARFLREGRALARVNHAHVVRVFDADQLSGYPYLVLEYLDGGSLRDALTDRGPVALPRFFELILPLLDGLSACHDAGIVHRDVKSENVLLGRDGAPSLADMGLARLLDTASELTGAGNRVGTPRAMAPEVVQGEPAGTPSDIYAAGVLMFEMLTGGPPFVTASVGELLMMHLRRPPPGLREQVPDLPAELDSLVRRCLAKEPDARPASAAELRDALAQIGGARPRTVARKRGPARTEVLPRAPLAAARRPRWLGPALAIVTGLAAAALVLRPGSAPEPVVPAASAAPARRSEGVRMGSGSLLEPGITALALSPDRRLVASSGNRRGVVSVWDALTGRCVRRLGDASRAYAVSLAFTGESDRVLVGWHGGAVESFDLAGGAPVPVAGGRALAPGENQDDADPLAVGWLANGHAFAVALEGGEARVALEGRRGSIALEGRVRWSPRPAMRVGGATGRVASVDTSGVIRVWEVAGGSLQQEEPARVTGAVWAWNAGRVAWIHSAANELEGDSVVVWDLGDHRIAASWALPPAPLAVCQALELSDDGHAAIAGVSALGERYHFEWRALDAPARPRAEVPCPGWPGRRSATPDGRWVAYADAAGLLHVVCQDGTRFPRTSSEAVGHRDGVTALVFLPDGRLASAGLDRQLLVWDPATGRPAGAAVSVRGRVDRLELDPATGAVRAAGGTAPPASGRWQVEVRDGAALAVRDRTAPGAAWTIRGRLGAPVTAFAVSGDRLAAGAADGEIRVWRLP